MGRKKKAWKRRKWRKNKDKQKRSLSKKEKDFVKERKLVKIIKDKTRKKTRNKKIINW